MTLSNSVFLAIRENAPLVDTGWLIRVLHYSDFTTPVAIINDFTKLAFTTELNDPGTGAITLDLEDDFWDSILWSNASSLDLLEHDYLYQLWENGSHRFDFIGTRKKLDEVADDEEETLTISGPGVAAALKWGVIMPPNFPNYNKDVHWPTNLPAMQLYHKLLKHNQSVGIFPYIIPSFTQTKDSSGVVWADLSAEYTTEITYGQDLLTTLGNATGQDDSDPWNIRADWYMRPGCILDVSQSFGSHLESKVRFFEGDILDKSRDRNGEDVRNYVMVRDTAGIVSLVHDPASEATFQKRAYLDVSHANITDTKLRVKVALNILQGKKEEVSEWSIQVPYDRPTRRPFLDYNVGDWIGVMKYSENKSSSMMSFRVIAITIDVDVEGPKVELTLESPGDAKRKKLERDLTKLINRNPLSDIKIPTNPYTVPDNVPYPIVWDPSKGFYVKMD